MLSAELCVFVEPYILVAAVKDRTWLLLFMVLIQAFQNIGENPSIEKILCMSGLQAHVDRVPSCRALECPASIN